MDDQGSNEHRGAMSPTSTAVWEYEVPSDPMDDLQCDSCQ